MQEVTIKNIKIISIVFFLIAIGISCIFVNNAIKAAEIKDFWLDEDFVLGLEKTTDVGNIRNHSYLEILLGNVERQGSPAPLDYMIVKFIDQIRDPIHSLGLPFNVYYRLHTIFYAVISGLIVLWILYTRIRIRTSNNIIFGIQSALLLIGLFLYYFHPKNFYYSIEMRPYALWNSLWFIAMGLLLYDKKYRRPLTIVLVLLALTASASIFQLFALGLSYVIIHIIGKDKWKEIVASSFRIFTLPTLICLYYVFGKTQSWGYKNFEVYLMQFFYFWINNERVWLISLLGILMTITFKKFRYQSIVFLTMLILYLMSPFINYATISHEFFFSPRQYRYYGLIYPLFLMSLALIFPHLCETITLWRQKTKHFHTRKVINYSLVKNIIMAGLIMAIALSFYDDYGTDKVVKINRQTPTSYKYLIEISEGKKDDRKKLEEYARYYRLVVKHMPNRSDVYGILGFCSYYLGKVHKAISYYEKAIALNPKFFWSYYNLGIIYFENKQYQKASEILEKSLQLNLMDSFHFILASRQIYMPIVKTRADNLPNFLDQQLRIGYHDAYELLILSHYHQKNFIEVKRVFKSFAGWNHYSKGRVDYCVGVANYYQKEYNDAIYFLAESLKQLPDHTDTYHYLSLSFEASGNDNMSSMIAKQGKLLQNNKESFITQGNQIRLQAF